MAYRSEHIIQEDIIGDMPEAEIYDLSEPEEDYVYELAKLEDMFLAEHDISLASIYNQAFDEARVNPLFKEHFQSVIQESLNQDNCFEEEAYFKDTHVECPDYRIHTSEHDRFAYYIYVHMPKVVNANEIDVDVNQNRLVVACLLRNYFLDITLPVTVCHKKVTSYFNKLTRTLMLKMPLKDDAVL